MPAAGQAFSPKITVGTVQKMASHVTFTQVSGGTFTVPAGNNPWNARLRLLLDRHGLWDDALRRTGEFTGADNGATAWFAGYDATGHRQHPDYLR